MTITTATLKLNRSITVSLPIYAAGLLEAMETAKINADPTEVLEESDRWPRLAKIGAAEMLIGWFQGVAETLGVTTETIWNEAMRLMPAAAAPAKRARRGKAA